MSDAKEQAMTDDMQRAVELANEIIDRWGTSAPWARDGRTLATALLASRAEVERMRAVFAKLVECFDDGSLCVEHTEIELDAPAKKRIGNADSGDAWFEPVCGDDHDACSRETCPAIWVVNDAAKFAEHQWPIDRAKVGG